MRRYRRDDHAELAAWHAARGLDVPPPEALPEFGLIEAGVAAGFLYRTDSTLCLLEGIIANPAAPLRARSLAVHAIVSGLEEEARRCGFRLLVGITETGSMRRLVSRLGFREVGRFAMMAKAA